MDLKSGNRKMTVRVPKLHSSFIVASGIQTNSVVGQLSGFMNKSSLIYNITLRFPLPNDQLT